MPNGKPRIDRSIYGFNTQIRQTYIYLMKACEASLGGTNWNRLGWSTVEITQWGSFYNRWIRLYDLYINKKGTRTTDVKDEMLMIIQECRIYNQTHNLYDRIAVSPYGTSKDFSMFNIIRNTPLAKTKNKRASDPDMKTVVIGFHKFGHLFHELLVTSKNKKGRGKEKGVAQILVYVTYTEITAAYPSFKEFHYIGDVFRGLLLVSHNDENKGKMAWYTARVKNSRGVLGSICDFACAVVM